MNPWISVEPGDYEAHMTSPTVGQMPALAGILARDLATYRPRSLLVVGCATGNGFEHIDPGVTVRVTGIDINPAFLAVLRGRHGARLQRLELIAGDVLDPAVEPGTFDLVHVGLLFEHLPWQPALRRVADWVAPAGVLSVVLQLPSAEAAPVSPTSIARRYPRLAETMQLVDPGEFMAAAGILGLAPDAGERLPLPQGKAFLATRYVRRAATGE